MRSAQQRPFVLIESVGLSALDGFIHIIQAFHWKWFDVCVWEHLLSYNFTFGCKRRVDVNDIVRIKWYKFDGLRELFQGTVTVQPLIDHKYIKTIPCTCFYCVMKTFKWKYFMIFIIFVAKKMKYFIYFRPFFFPNFSLNYLLSKSSENSRRVTFSSRFCPNSCREWIFLVQL